MGMVVGSLLVDIPTCREFVRRQWPASATASVLLILVLAWSLVLGWSLWTIFLIGLTLMLESTARTMVIMGRTLWIMHRGNSYWRFEIDDEHVRVFNLRGIQSYSRSHYSRFRDLGPLWRLSTPFGLAAVVIPKAAFPPADQAAVAMRLKRTVGV
jgi:hypothetical protein